MRNGILFAILIVAIAGCSGKKNNAQPALPPGKATLTAPAQNAVCITGSVISDTQSSLTLIWNASDHTDSYDVTVKNLLTSAITTQSTTHTQLTLTLQRSTPYSWHVVSKSNQISTTAQSDTWKFYNAGPGVVTYAPFPAEITAPTYGQTITTATVNLTWTGSSVNSGTITNYDVYFGTSSTPPLFKSAVTDSFVNGVALTAATTYYWRVITHDTNGNTSDSGLYQFSTN
ncbi:MAG: hypothetical protein JST19_02000 [Bacteroidetes bacterium]|nr:hypothetical protein [Bacteroidota bacterium]